MFSQTLQKHSEVLLNAPAVMEVISGCYEIWFREYSNFEAPETSAQICRRLQEQLRLLRSSAGDVALHSHSSGSYTTTRQSYHIRLCYSHKNHYITIWYTWFKSLYIYTYGQSGHRLLTSIIGGSPGYNHWEDIEVYHMEAVVVKRWS
jgi:hypothetical protein